LECSPYYTRFGAGRSLRAPTACMGADAIDLSIGHGSRVPASRWPRSAKPPGNQRILKGRSGPMVKPGFRRAHSQTRTASDDRLVLRRGQCAPRQVVGLSESLPGLPRALSEGRPANLPRRPGYQSRQTYPTARAASAANGSYAPACCRAPSNSATSAGPSKKTGEYRHLLATLARDNEVCQCRTVTGTN
jgi:hypothetical protein